MKQVTRIFVCGNSNATPGIAWCFPGDHNCNNYCNHDHSKPMPDSPKTYDTIIWEEKDMWQDVINILAEWIPREGGPTIFEHLMSLYEIKEKPTTHDIHEGRFSPMQLKMLASRGWDCRHMPPSKPVHFGWNTVEVIQDGKIRENYTAPVNVDPDDASYDTRETIYLYKTFDDFLNHHPESKSTRII
jgi:hypothetical protein